MALSKAFKKYTSRRKNKKEPKGKIAHSFNYDYIKDGIYIGSNACCTVHFRPELIKKGVEADVSLQDDKIDAPYGAKYFLWLPVKDHAPPTAGQFDIGVAALGHFVKKKIMVYVHCKNGHGRAPTLVAAYLVSTGKSVKDALELIKQRRQVMHLEKRQIEALKRYEQRVKQRMTTKKRNAAKKRKR